MIDKYNGKPFPTTPGLMRSWATGRVRRREVSRETIYCAELVAVTMQHMGLLPDKRPMSWYDPGKFWSGDDIVARRAVLARRGDRRPARVIGVGVIGAGLMGSIHARLVATAVPDAELVAVCDPDREAAERVAREHGVGVVYADAFELIAASTSTRSWSPRPCSRTSRTCSRASRRASRCCARSRSRATREAAWRIVEAERAGGRRLRDASASCAATTRATST